MTRSMKIALLPLLLGVSLAAILILDLGSYLSFEVLADNRDWLIAHVAENALISALSFILVYIGAVAFSVSGATILTLTGGFLFGTLIGGLYAIIGATTGATVLFLIARTSLGEMFRPRTEGVLAKLKDGFCRDSLNYLLFLRLVPLFPFWLINLAAAFFGVPTRIFALGTAVGIVPGALVYASVGNGLGVLLDRGEVPDLGIIFSPVIFLPLLGLAVLSLVPVLLKRLRRDKTALSH